MDAVVFGLSHNPAYEKRFLKHATRFILLWASLCIIIAVLVYAVSSFMTMAHGDINRDGIVDSKDYALVISNRSEGELIAGDLNYDGVVDNQDLQVLMSEWSNKTIYTKDAPKANVATPKMIITKPVVFTQ